MDSCSACHSPTEWDSQANSHVCVSCGILSDATQISLESHPISSGATTHSATTLTSSRTGWHLAGQHSETRDRRNKLTAAQFIQDLARHCFATREADRANGLFIQAMQRGKYKWGRKSKIVAAACLALALRESNRPGSFREMSLIIQEPPVDISRTFSQLLSLFELNFDLLDPAVHLPHLLAKFTELLDSMTLASASSTTTISPIPSLPGAIITKLKQISPQCTLRSSEDLLQILVRHERQHVIALELQSTAAGALILTLEAEMRQPFPNLSQIAACFASILHVNKNVILTRYKAIQEYVYGCILKIEWLAPTKKTRVVNQRLSTARGLKDVLQFQSKIWKEEVDKSGLATLTFLDGDTTLVPRLSKQKRTRSPPLFILGSGQGGGHDSPRKRARRTTRLLPSATTATICDSFFLANDHLGGVGSASSSLTTAIVPTRLQLLSHARGGGAEAVMDDELFAEGELDGMIRSQMEVERYASQVDWLDGDDHLCEQQRSSPSLGNANAGSGGDIGKVVGVVGDDDRDHTDLELALLPMELDEEDEDEQQQQCGWRSSLASHLATTFSFQQQGGMDDDDIQGEGGYSF